MGISGRRPAVRTVMAARAAAAGRRGRVPLAMVRERQEEYAANWRRWEQTLSRRREAAPKTSPTRRAR